ncbi:MAG: hypothetical protein JEZ06_24740 [Anaerolineaceae bacterium]|nr:hypothetical protein [Anaerolineaceae bacterium]
MAKQEKTPLRLNAPINEDLEKAKDAFVSGSKDRTADQPQAATRKNLMPWEEPLVSERVIKAFNLRLTEPDFLKLKFVVEQTSAKSMHSFCMDVVRKEVEKQLKKLT